jgi:sugar porter (SP) family MFS transporter
MFALIRQIPLYFKATMICALGGLIFGIDTGTIGPITAMTSFKASFGDLSATAHGLVVSSILLSGAVSGLFAGNIADVYGRASSFVFGGTIFGIGAAIEASAQSLGMFIAGRVIAGFGEGLFLGNLAVYICEIVPARKRGPLTSLIQCLVCVGIAAGYFISYGTAKIGGSMSWRIPLMIHSILAFTFALGCCFISPSPRWLFAKGRVLEARETMASLGLASAELEEMENEANLPLTHSPTSLVHSIKIMMHEFTLVFRKGARSRAALACFLMAFQQFSGIDGVLYYAPFLFAQAGLAQQQASFLASGVSALLMMAITFPATYYSDHWGRKTSAISGGVVMSGIMLLIGSLYAADAVHADQGIGRWVVVVCIYLFALVYCATWAITMRLYASEIQPMNTRASASSLAQSSNWVSFTKCFDYKI